MSSNVKVTLNLGVRPLVLAAGGLAVAITLSACGGGGSGTTPVAAANPSSSTVPGGGQAGGQGRVPVTSGEVVQVVDKTLQVQNTAAQTAVTYSTSTTFTQRLPATKAAVTVGSCVTAMSAVTSGGSSAGSSSPGGSGAAGATTVAATSVTISQPVKGECTAGFGGAAFGGGGFGGGGYGGGTRPSGMPSGMPSGSRPSGAAGYQRQGGFGANGKVTAVSASGFTVQSVRYARRATASGSASPAPSSSPSPSTSTVSVTVTSATTYSTTVKATASAATVGRCVTAIGKADDTGTVAATSIAVSQKTNGSCSTGRSNG